MDLIDVVGLDEEIRCEMCKNPMHTNRGCDGHCKYDEKLYERIIQILDKRITPLPPAPPEQDVLAWLLAYYTKSFEMHGRYLPHEVISWLVNDFSKEFIAERREE